MAGGGGGRWGEVCKVGRGPAVPQNSVRDAQAGVGGWGVRVCVCRGGSSLIPPSAHPPGWTGPSLGWKCLRLHPLSSRTVSSDPERSLSRLLALTRSLLEGEQPRAPDPRTWRPDGWTGPPTWTWHVFCSSLGARLHLGSLPSCPHPLPQRRSAQQAPPLSPQSLLNHSSFSLLEPLG